MMIKSRKPLSIYIHIPFCKQKCLYCDFLSAPACAQERESYVKALLREISFMADYCSENYEVISVFFGGGTPSLLSSSQMERILSAIRKEYCLLKDAEITAECNPATAGVKKLQKYRACGINRLSIGLQSADDTQLRILGRIHTYDQFLDTFAAAREAGFENINIDVMSALPGQSLASYEDTLHKVIALEPEHISAYSLIIEEGTPFYERYGEKKESDRRNLSGNTLFSDQSESRREMEYPLLPDEDTERKMYHHTYTILKKAGYDRYEISNYAKKGCECRHNLTYWTGVEYLGLGLGAASYIGGYRYKNTDSMIKYQSVFGQNAKFSLLEKKQQSQTGDSWRKQEKSPFMPTEFMWHEEVCCLSLEEKIEEFMFLGLRLKKGISETEFLKKFGRTVEKVYPDVLPRLIREGVLLRNHHRIYLSQKGTDVANYVMAEFLLSC